MRLSVKIGAETGKVGEKQDHSRAMVQDDCLFPGRAYLELMTVHFPFQNTYAALPAGFFERVAPTPVTSPRLIKAAGDPSRPRS
jgi:hypothetical protein